MKIKLENLTVPEHMEDGELISVYCRGRFIWYGFLVTRIENGVILNLSDAAIEPFMELLPLKKVPFHVEIK